jgi:zinc transporter ZupT
MDTYLVYTLLAGAIIALISLIGRLTAIGAFHSFVTRHLSVLTSFSSGVFFIIALGLLFEAIEKTGSSYLVFVLVAVGFIGVSLLFRFIPEAHHHHSEDIEHSPHSVKSAQKLLVADFLHNIGDGIVLGSAFLLDISFGIATAVSLAVHESIQEISEYFVLRQAGYSAVRALSFSFLVSLSIFIGIIVRVVLSNVSYVEVVVIALASGALLHIVFEDMFPHSIRLISNKESRYHHLLAVLMGVSFMVILLFLGGHE